MKSYNESCNWSKYISMVSDIRTVCPLNALAENFTKLYSDSFVSFYISKVCIDKIRRNFILIFLRRTILRILMDLDMWLIARQISQQYLASSRNTSSESTYRGSSTSLSRATFRSLFQMLLCLTKPTQSSVMKSAKYGKMALIVLFQNLGDSFNLLSKCS